MAWDDSYGLSSLAYKAERYFSSTLAELFPVGAVSSSGPKERGVAFIFLYKHVTFHVQVKVTPKSELLPPTHLEDIIEPLQRDDRDHAGKTDRFLLVTNYFLPPVMAERLTRANLIIYRFGMEDDNQTVRQGLSEVIRENVVT